MSSGGGVAAAVEGGIEGGAVLPAAPDDPQPGAGQDPDGVRMPAAAAGRGGVDRGGPRVAHAAAVGEVHDGGAEFLAARPAEHGLAALAGLARRRARPGQRGERVIGGEPLAAVADLGEQGRGADGPGAGQAGEDVPVGMRGEQRGRSPRPGRRSASFSAASMTANARVIWPRASPSAPVSPGAAAASRPCSTSALDAAGIAGRAQPRRQPAPGTATRPWRAVGNLRKNARLIPLAGLVNRPIAPGNASSRFARSCPRTCTRVSTRSLRDRHNARSARVAPVSGRSGFHRCPSVRSVSASTYASNRSSLFPADPYRVRRPLICRLGTTNTASPRIQQLLDHRAVTALDRHPGHARGAQPPDHRPDRRRVMSEAEPAGHRAVPVHHAGDMNLRRPVDPRNNALQP